MGAVELVYDELRGQAIARKRARSTTAEAILAFKREFRAIEHLSHPGLVRLYELGEDDEGLYYTMEYVEGDDLLSRCRGRRPGEGDDDTDAAMVNEANEIDTAVGATIQRPPTGPPDEEDLRELELRVLARQERAVPDPVHGDFDLARLAAALPQVIEALAFLHAQDVIHRDLKPSNVLVRDSGVVKLLDFGILGHARHADPEAGKVVGTVGYMAPEQIHGERPSPATDIYALGAILFEIVTGRPVFKGKPREVIEAHDKYVPPDLDQLVADLPPGLSRAVAAMLHKNPAQRPSLKQLARTLLRAIGGRAPIHVQPPRPLPVIEGRESEQRVLRRTIDSTRRIGAFACVVLDGTVGCGKSTLAAWATRQAERKGLIVLRGGGTARQQVSFNAIDGAIDALALELNRRPLLDLGPWLSIAAEAFPVLAADPVPPQARGPLPPKRTFEAVAELVRALARASAGLILLVDDLHLADADSVALLDGLLDEAPPGVFVLGTIRADAASSAATAWLERRGDDHIRRLDVGPLPSSALETIIRRLARKGGAEVDAADVAKVAANCDGLPLLAQLAGMALAKTGAGHEGLVPSLAAIVARTSAASQEVLAALAAAGSWTPIATLARVSAHSPGHVEDVVAGASKLGLVRHTAPLGPMSEVDFLHPLIRDAVLETVGPEQIATLRAALDALAVPR